MSDNVFDTFGDDDDIFAEDEEEQQPEGEGQNRTFIIAVAVLGGLLVCALISFGVWALVLNKPQQATPPVTEIVATVTVEAPAAEADTTEPATETPAPTDTPEPATETPAPTDTPEPTATPLLGPTATPTLTDEEADAAESMAAAPGDTEAEDAEPTATQAPRRTPTPTRTPRATSTPRPGTGETATGYGASSSGELSQTGLGEWLLVGGAVLLVAIVVLARRLRASKP